MIILDTTTRSLEIILGGAITTNQLPWVVSYVDTGATPPLAQTNGNTNSAVAVSMVSAPSSGKVKIVKNISIYNNDTASATVTVRVNDNSTLRKLHSVTLATGYQLTFTDTGGWAVTDASGSFVGISTPSGSAGGDLTGTYPNPTIAANAVTTTKINNAAVTLAKIANAVANSVLVGAGSSGSGAAYTEITLGSGLSMSSTTLSATATGSSKPFMVWTPAGNNPPASAYATPDTRNSHLTLDFDGATDEEAVFAGVLGVGYAAGGLTCETWWSFTSATSGNLRVQAAIERMDVSSLDIDADSFAAFQSAGGTAPGTSGQFVKVTITFTDGAQMDSLAAGEAFRLKIRRDADGTSGTDDITTDAELLRVVLRET